MELFTNLSKGRSERVGGRGPTSRFWERSRLTRFRQAEMAAGSDELMELLERERLEREGRLQREMGKEPASEAPSRASEATEPSRLQATPVHLQGVASAADQEESGVGGGSERESFALRRRRPSWFRAREKWLEWRIKKMRSRRDGAREVVGCMAENE